MEKIRQKRYAIFSKNNPKSKAPATFRKWINLRADHVKSYFNGIRSGRVSGEFCERCSIGIGHQYINKEPNYFKGWCLCDDCYEYKTATPKKPELTPDIEDFGRFNIGR